MLPSTYPLPKPTVSQTFRRLTHVYLNSHRAVSRVDLSSAVACSSSSGGGSTSSLSAIGRSTAVNSAATSPRRYVPMIASSAPATPRGTPPVSPQHWPRRLSGMRPSTPQLPHIPGAGGGGGSQLATVKSEATTPIT